MHELAYYCKCGYQRYLEFIALPAFEKLVFVAVPPTEMLLLLLRPVFRIVLTDFVSSPITVPLIVLATLPESEITFFYLLSRKAWASAAILSSFRSSFASFLISDFIAFAVFGIAELVLIIL